MRTHNKLLVILAVFIALMAIGITVYADDDWTYVDYEVWETSCSHCGYYDSYSTHPGDPEGLTYFGTWHMGTGGTSYSPCPACYEPNYGEWECEQTLTYYQDIYI